MELILILRTVIVLVISGLLVEVMARIPSPQKRRGAARRVPKGMVFIAIGLFVAWAGSEVVVWKAIEVQKEARVVAETQSEIDRVRVGRLLAVHLHTAYHATADEAMEAVSTEGHLDRLADSEGIGIPATGWPEGREPLPLVIRRCRRAIFELLPLFEYDPALVRLAVDYFRNTDPQSVIALELLLSDNLKALLALRREWAAQTALPALYRVREELLVAESPGAAHQMAIPLPAELWIAPAGPTAPPTVPLSITTIPVLERETRSLNPAIPRN